MKLKASVILLGLLLVAVCSAHAQVINPCDGNDPDTTYCPIDSGVIFLAIAAVLFAVCSLARKREQAA